MNNLSETWSHIRGGNFGCIYKVFEEMVYFCILKVEYMYSALKEYLCFPFVSKLFNFDVHCSNLCCFVLALLFS